VERTVLKNVKSEGEEVKAIYLTGFMGAGKTTIGKKLGNVLQLPVIDTDEYIERQAGKSIADIFAEEGEETFRMYERQVLKMLPTENVIITTGGGMVIQAENREWMKTNGTVVYLHCDVDELVRRLEHDSSRPLLSENKRMQIERLFRERLPFYKEATVTIDTTGKSIDETVAEIVAVLKDQKRWP
jgi:shikimate kinase